MNNLSKIQFTISDIQIGLGDHEFDKALALYQKGCVKKIKENYLGYDAIVSGTHDYKVSVSSSFYDRGNCDCYIGQKGELCKHMIALAIALVYKHRPNDTKVIEQPLDQAVCLGEVRNINKEELEKTKSEISHAMTFIKSYNGPSSKWFLYQDSLITGSRLILLALSRIPVCEKSAIICIDTLKKLDKKVLNGIDDSDGTIGELMCQIVEVLNLFVCFDNNLKGFIANKLPNGESFDWESGFKSK